jgi:hypothetical protein
LTLETADSFNAAKLSGNRTAQDHLRKALANAITRGIDKNNVNAVAYTDITLLTFKDGSVIVEWQVLNGDISGLYCLVENIDTSALLSLLRSDPFFKSASIKKSKPDCPSANVNNGKGEDNECSCSEESSASSSSSSLPIIAGAAAGGALLVIIVIVILVRRRRGQPRNRVLADHSSLSSSSNDQAMSFHNPSWSIEPSQLFPSTVVGSSIYGDVYKATYQVSESDFSLVSTIYFVYWAVFFYFFSFLLFFFSWII